MSGRPADRPLARSGSSTKVWEKATPYDRLSLHPDHSKPEEVQNVYNGHLHYCRYCFILSMNELTLGVFLLTAACLKVPNKQLQQLFSSSCGPEWIYLLHFSATEDKLTFGTDPLDLPVTATPLQLPAGAGPGHSHCHGYRGQSMNEGCLTSAWKQQQGGCREICILGHENAGMWRFSFYFHLDSSLCQIHWSHVEWWNNSSDDSWTGADTEVNRTSLASLRHRNQTIVSCHTSSITISAALRTDSITSPRALHTPTCPGVNPLSRAHGAAPDTGLERGSLARELGHTHTHKNDVSRMIHCRFVVQKEKDA